MVLCCFIYLQVLLHCHAVLAEMPESLLVHKHFNTTASLHHMIAAIAYHVGKVMYGGSKLRKWHDIHTVPSRSLTDFAKLAQESSLLVTG